MMALLFMLGVIVFSYPFVVDTINNYYDQQMIEKLQVENQVKFQEAQASELAQMAQENEQLRTQKKLNLPGIGLMEDPFQEAEPKADTTNQTYVEKSTVGAIYIPDIHVSLPLFDHTDSRLLNRGATILQGTSFPIGGASSHAVITGHSGLPNKMLFTDLEKLALEDVFFIDIAGTHLAYQVDTIQTVLPNQIESLKIQKNKDLVTLVTCTPYMINTHRLLVTGHRIPYIETMASQKAETEQYHKHRFYRLLLLGPLFLGLIFYWMWRKFVYYQSGKYRYDFQFKCCSLSEPLSFILLDRKKRPVTQDAQTISTTTNEAGGVIFSNLRGGTYWAQSEFLGKQILVKGYVYRLKNPYLTIRRSLKSSSRKAIVRVKRGRQS